MIDSIVWVSSRDCPDFYDAELRAHHEHLRTAYGISPGNDALETVRGFQGTSAALATLSGDETDRAIERLREVLAAHYRAEHGVVFDSRSWLITARRSHRH